MKKFKIGDKVRKQNSRKYVGEIVATYIRTYPDGFKGYVYDVKTNYGIFRYAQCELKKANIFCYEKKSEKTKQYLVRIQYGWSKYELENMCYESMRDVEAYNENEAINKVKVELEHSYLGGEKHIPIYYKILGWMEKGQVWNKDHRDIYIEGQAKKLD